MWMYRVYDDYDGVELLYKGNNAQDAVAEFDQRFEDTDGECYCTIEAWKDGVCEQVFEYSDDFMDYVESNKDINESCDKQNELDESIDSNLINNFKSLVADMYSDDLISTSCYNEMTDGLDNYLVQAMNESKSKNLGEGLNIKGLETSTDSITGEEVYHCNSKEALHELLQNVVDHNNL